MQCLYNPWTALEPKHALLFVIFFIAFALLQLQLYKAETEDRRIPKFSFIDASFESRHTLRFPITIVTAASGNHACALEAFLYHLNATLSQLSTDPRIDFLQQQERIRIGHEYAATSPDLEPIRKRPRGKKPKKTSAHDMTDEISTPPKLPPQDPQKQHPEEDGDPLNHSSRARLQEPQQAEPLSTLYEIRPRVVVYNMGMGPTKRKRRLLKALAEAGFMDEILDFDFDPYPAFWRLDPETRGEYGWKAGIIEEVCQNILHKPSTTESSGRILSSKRSQDRPNTQDVHLDEEVAKWAGIEELADEGTNSAVDEEALDELEQDFEARPPLPSTSTTAQPLSTAATLKQAEHAKVPLTQPSHNPNIVLWLDSGDRISTGFLRWLPSFLLHHGLWTPQSQDTMQTWTHPGLLHYYHDSLDSFAKDETNCNGAAIAFDIHNQTVRDGLLKEWIQCAKIKECIAPEGSNRGNHRQDQAALTYLVKTMGYGQDLCHGFPEDFGIQVNQDHFCKQDIAANPNRVVSS
ncbi:hypothetical protein BGZ68_005671 [Mortierella alpina]|nr:hypothetical protein BGZ68_005671 [Mortierella alpina]